MPNVVDVLINWFPMLLLIAVWIYFFRRLGGRTYLTKFQSDYMEQMKRQNDVLERIAAAVEKNAAK